MEILAIISSILLFGFIVAGVCRFGLLHSYSAYSTKWGSFLGMPVWSLVTFFAAFLLMPVLIELGVGSAFQFLGFLTPVYLMGVSLTPGWQGGGEVFRYHVVLAGLCAVCGMLWTFLTVGAFSYVVPVVVILLGLVTGTWRKDYIFWLEMVAFLSVYSAALVLLL